MNKQGSCLLALLMLLMLVPAAGARDLSISPGATFSLGSSTFSLGGNWNNEGVFVAGTGVVVFNGDGARTIAGTNAFYDLIINKTNAADAVDASGSALSVTNRLSVAGGIFTSASAFKDVAIEPPGTLALSGDITVSGQWQNQGGTFTHNNHTVTLNGTDQSIFGNTAFYNLTKQTATAATLTFESNATTVIDNTLTLQGAAGQLLSLRASAPGVRGNIDPRGDRVLDYLDVQDSENINALDIDVIGRHCLDSGNNVKWVFLADMTMAVSPASNGSTTPVAGSVTGVEGGLPQNIEASAGTGYHFVNWTATPETNAAFGNALSPSTTVILTGAAVITANFAINVYTLTYTATANGTIAGESSQQVARGGSGTPVIAVPDTGYHFVKWSDGLTANPRTDTIVTADIRVMADFVINTYTLAYTAGPGGTVTGTSPQTVNHGADGTMVTAVPNSGFSFLRWSDGVTSATRKDVNVTGDVSATAEFTAAQDLPPDLDLDGNGRPDLEQTDITVVTDGTGRYFGLVLPEEYTLEYLEWIDAALVPDMTNRPDNFPLGLVRFRVLTVAAGDTIELTIYCSEAIPEGTVWYKHDPVNGWYDYSAHAVISEDRMSVTLSFQDGGFGDADGVVNGVIEASSGPALFYGDDGDDGDAGNDEDDGDGIGGGGHHGGGGCFLESIYEIGSEFFNHGIK